MERNDWNRDGEIKVSIIIPVYNGEEYLEQCIQSALNQTMEELEIICVDDGSTDHSAEMIANLARKDSRIVLIQQNNQGPGPARNTGIQQARGEYIAFLDADDSYYDKKALELMYNACKMGQVAVCASQKLCKILITNELQIEQIFPDLISDNFLYYKDYQIDYYYQNYLFQRKMLIENAIYFPDYRRYQDPPFFVKALYKAQVFAVADTCLYCYRDSNSVLKFNTHKTADLLRGIIDNLRFAEEHNLDLLFHATATRLEYDFLDVICNNFSITDLTILELLLKANQFVYKKYDYNIKPLRKILFSEKRYQRQLLKIIAEYNEIVLYGAGKYARLLLDFLKQQKCMNKVVNFVVSDLKENDLSIEGIPILSFDNFLRGKRQFILIATGERYQREILRNLKKYEGIHYEIIDEFFFHCLEKKSCFSCEGLE